MSRFSRSSPADSEIYVSVYEAGEPQTADERSWQDASFDDTSGGDFPNRIEAQARPLIASHMAAV